MYRVQNLSNRSITFQGVTIPAHSFADFTVINPIDFIALSRFCNSGKARYTRFEPKAVAEEVAPVKIEEPVTVATPVEEVAEPVVESVANETVVEDVPNEDTIPENDIPAKPTKRTRKSKNDDSDSK